MTDTERWAAALLRASDAIKAARIAIQGLTTLTEGDAEMKLTFAASATYGIDALLREADFSHRQLNLPPLEDRR